VRCSGSGHDGGGREAAEGSFAVLHGLFWAVIDLAEEQPLLLAVDDLQWVEELPVMLLATIRSGEPDVDEDLLSAVRQPPARVLEPGHRSSRRRARIRRREEQHRRVVAQRLG
jgi:hypothetical protein